MNTIPITQKKVNPVLKPYTKEELRQMVLDGERQFANGLWQDSEDMFRELEEEDFAEEELVIAEAV